jgi:hypothetical protein
MQNLDRYCGILRLQNIVVSGGRCPYCLADSKLKAAGYWDGVQTQFVTSDEFRNHLLGHIHLLRQRDLPVNCPHPRCSDTDACTWQDLLHHFWDDHGILEDLSETENFAQPPPSDLEESLFVRSDEEFDVIPEPTSNKKKRWEAKPFYLGGLIHDIRGGSRVWDHTHPPIYTILNLGSGGARELGTDSGFSEVLVNDLQAPRRTRKRVGLPVSGSFVVANGAQTGAITCPKILLQSSSPQCARKRPGLWRTQPQPAQV